MFMRLCTPLSFCLTAAAVLVLVPAQTARADVSSCAGADERAFPLATRIRGGPGSYAPGGEYGTWYIDLTNTTRKTCADIHPVVVLTDSKRALKPSQPRLDFYDGPRARPVSFARTDEQELVGVLDGDGFRGFSVPPGRTVSVKVRLAVTPDVAADQVTLNAAVVQRRGQDGDWVGESNDYRFEIAEDKDKYKGKGKGEEEESGASPAGTPRATPGSADPDESTSLPFAQDAQEAEERARELAETGPELAYGLLAATSALLAVGAGAFLLTRRRRR
ncbi:hypothetical protein [Streptomyces sp. NPDC002671]